MRANRLEMGRRQRQCRQSSSKNSLCSRATLCFPNKRKPSSNISPASNLSSKKKTIPQTSTIQRVQLSGRLRSGRRCRVRSQTRQAIIQALELEAEITMGSAAEPSDAVQSIVAAIPMDIDEEESPTPAPESPMTPKIYNTRARRSVAKILDPGHGTNAESASGSDSEWDPDESLELNKSKFNSTAPSSDKNNSNATESDNDEESPAAKSSASASRVSFELCAGAGTNSGLKYMTADEIMKAKESRTSPRKLKIPEIKVFHNPEDYFLAPTRVKYKGEDTEATAKKGPKKPRKGNRHGTAKDSNLPERSTSNFSVSKELANIVDNHPIVEKHAEYIDKIQQEIVKDFPHWIYMLREGFNVMLYGYGSKLPIFREFKTFLNDEFMTMSVNGLFPKMNPRRFLSAFWDGLELGSKMPKNSSISGLADEICQVLSEIPHPNVFILVSNLEILASKHPQCFTALCSIVRVPFVHLVASCDHMNSFLGIDHGKSIQLNLYWVDCTTFAMYDQELTWKQDAFTGDGKESSSKSTLEHVLKSLTANARQAFKILADLQLGAMRVAGKTKSRDFSGIQFRELARRCREGFIAHTDMGLKTLLVEFVDHKLIRYNGKNKKEDVLVIDLEIETLEKLGEM